MVCVRPSILLSALLGIWGCLSPAGPQALVHATVPTRSLVLCLATQQLVVHECASLFLIAAFLKACVMTVLTVGLPRKCISYICTFFPLFFSYMAMNFVLFWKQHL